MNFVRHMHMGTLVSLVALGLWTMMSLRYLPAVWVPSFQVLLLFTGQALTLGLVWGFRYHWIVRPVLLVALYVLPLVAGLPMLPLVSTWNPWLPVLVLLGSALPLSIRVFDLRVSLDRELMPFLPRVDRGLLLRRTWYAWGGAIGEELFYRGYLLPVLHAWIGWTAHLVTSVIFLWMHWFGPFRSEFKYRDYLSIAMVSIFAGGLSLQFHSVLPAMGLHLLFNTPAVLHFWLRYRCRDEVL